MSETLGCIRLGHLELSITTNLLNANSSFLVYSHTLSKAQSLVREDEHLVTKRRSEQSEKEATNG